MTPAQAMDLGNELIHLLTQQRLLYRQLRDLAQKQSSLVDGSDPEMLLRVLADRQRLIDRLTTIDRQLQPMRRDWQKVAETLPAEQRQQAQQLISQVREILSDIIARDEQDSQTLSARQQSVAQQIRFNSTAQRMNQAYNQTNTPTPSRHFDTQCE